MAATRGRALRGAERDASGRIVTDVQEVAVDERAFLGQRHAHRLHAVGALLLDMAEGGTPAAEEGGDGTRV
jgi:hypothetical protein